MIQRKYRKIVVLGNLETEFVYAMHGCIFVGLHFAQVPTETGSQFLKYHGENSKQQNSKAA